MNEKTTKRREWVKNAAIIFLSIMLVLTFFSNTIMNYSLPEVATQYVQSGSITAKIRGTGTVEASDPYNLIINDTRVIESVAVKAGDEVEKGDTIFVLESKESAELKTAREELVTLETALDSAILAYETKILDGSLSAGTIAGVQSGNVESLKTAQARVQAAKDRLTNLQSTKAGYEASLANLTTQETLLANSSTYDAAERAAAAEEARQNAQRQLNDAQAQLDAANAQVTALEAWFTGNGFTSQADANQKVLEAQEAMNRAEMVKTNAYAIWQGEPDGKFEKYVKDPTSGAPTDQIASDFSQKSELFGETLVGLTWAEIYNLKDAAYQNEVLKYNTIKAAADQFAAKQNELNNAQAAKISAEQQVANCNATLQNLGTGSSSSTSTDLAAQQKAIADQKAQLTASITKIDAEITAAQAEQTQILADVAGELNLESQNAEIARAREKVREKEEEVAKLEEEQENPVVTAPVSGKITSLSYAAGETTKPGENAAVIQVAGKGFTLSFSVTNEQAKKVSAGDVAELQNSWYYNDVKATVAAIKPDTTNPSQNKLLVFDVSGEDVTAGQSLSLSVGQKSANYDLIVPNSAIREDKNGKFILIVESKSSPLGNRYFATRVDVEVLASDDTQTAISGALYGYEYVITTSTKPVEAGKQVRLTD